MRLSSGGTGGRRSRRAGFLLLLALAQLPAALSVAADAGGADAGSPGREERIRAWARTLRAHLASDPYPLIDLEVSLARWRSATRLIEGMNRAGVALAAVTAPDEEAIQKAVRRHPARLIPLTAQAGPEAWARDEARHLASVRRQLARGGFGIGPIAWRPAPAGADRTQTARTRRALRALIRLAASTRTPLWIQMAPHDAGLGRLERQLRGAPEARVIWTQGGWIPNPAALPGYGHGLFRALSLRHPNLSFTLTQEPPPAAHSPAARKNHLFDPSGALSAEWRALLEARVRHFAVGSALNRATTPAAYARRTRLFRERVLGKIRPPARERVAYQNAWRLLTRRRWRP